MRKLLFIFLLLPLQHTAQVNLDSLWSVWNDPNQADTNKLKAMKQISWDGYLFSQPDSAFYFAQMQYDFAKEKGLKKYMSDALNVQGTTFYLKSQYAKTLEYYTRTLKLREEIGDKRGIAGSLGNIGIVYKLQGNYAKAIDYYMRSLKKQEEIGEQIGIANSLNNIGIIYQDQGDNTKAMHYYEQSLKIHEEKDNKNGIMTSLTNIGNIYSEQNKYSKAITYFKRTLEISEEIGNKMGMAAAMYNIGMVYYNNGDTPNALKYQKQSLKLREEINHKLGIAMSLYIIGEIYQIQGNYNLAFEYCSKSLAFAKDINDLMRIKSVAISLCHINEKLGRYKAALEMYQLYISSKDSLESEENQRAVIRQEFQYNYEKHAAADSVKAAEEGKVKDAMLAAEQAENIRRKQQSYFLYGGLVLALIFGGFIFNRYKVTNQQKEIISEQKEEVDKAYIELEDKNQKILDSITYAKRIQNAILPPAKVIKEYLHESFIIYLPKDVVAGDFYWLENKGKKTFFAAADCTGHGVPGAMVSVVCNNGLNRSVREHEITDPGKILDKTREIVVQEFEKSEEEVKDGMDIALCSLEGKTLEYAGAHNPLVIVRKGSEECEVIKPNKEPIGQFDNPQPYTSHKIDLNEGDSIYLFSDGYQDQFGGPKGKKFMIAKLKKLLIEVSKQPMEKQKELILKAFNDWKGNEEQVDDVCVIGVRV